MITAHCRGSGTKRTSLPHSAAVTTELTSHPLGESSGQEAARQHTWTKQTEQGLVVLSSASATATTPGANHPFF